MRFEHSVCRGFFMTNYIYVCVFIYIYKYRLGFSCRFIFFFVIRLSESGKDRLLKCYTVLIPLTEFDQKKFSETCLFRSCFYVSSVKRSGNF